jgi:cellulose synthase/poly-beta-1,6-N-acetylglucosamine synthase-like glycosyltransferase
MSKPASPFTVCVLAHNEEKNIVATLQAIMAGAGANPFPVHVYANGCTDHTVAVCRALAGSHPNLAVHELAIASKPNAWNTAFAEQKAEFLVFSDGDVIPDEGAALELVNELARKPTAILASCTQVTASEGLSAEQKLVGLLQTPLHQDFLAGGFYAVRRRALAGLLEDSGYEALPAGVTGEDCFLDRLVGPERLLVAKCRSAYRPPGLSDYCRYLARLRWQNEQLELLLKKEQLPSGGTLDRFADKFKRSESKAHFLAMLGPVLARQAFQLLAGSVIRKNYEKLGPVRADGAGILSSSTRSAR